MAIPFEESSPYFGDFWRWMSLDGSGQLWTAGLRKQFQFLLAGYGRFWAGSASLWAALDCSGRFSEALKSVLDCSGRVWEALDGLWVCPGEALDDIGRGSGSSAGADLEGSGRLGNVGLQPGACSQLAE